MERELSILKRHELYCSYTESHLETQKEIAAFEKRYLKSCILSEI